jgi:hypothetical protein
MAFKHSTFSSLSWKDVLENNDRRMLEKNYAYSRFGPFYKISKVFPDAIFAAVHVPLNYLLMQYFFYLKNQIQKYIRNRFFFFLFFLAPLKHCVVNSPTAI